MRSLIAIVLTSALSIQSTSALTPEALADQIISLPGVPAEPTFNQYAGYLTIKDAVYPDNNRHIFYWHVESENDPVNDPLIFWTNGGPGCSGLIGFFEEFGPWHPNPDGKTLYENPYSWNKLANIVYIEAPAGVGFSYADNQTDYTVGDTRTARDNYWVIQEFLLRFPDFQTNGNKVFIAGESYGGHYIPTWTREIQNQNEAGINPHINFGGFLLGNPYTNPAENIIGGAGTWGGHSLIPSSLWVSIQEHCFPYPGDSECNNYQNQAQILVAGLDPYSLDTNVCVTSALPTHGVNQRQRLIDFINHDTNSIFKSSNRHRRLSLSPSHHRRRSTPTPTPHPYDPCVENYETVYLNRPEVQQAIHAKVVAPANQWLSCSNVVNYNMTEQNTHMELLYPDIFSHSKDGERYVIYSGDDDSVCGSLGTQSWLFDMNLNVKSNWSAWSLDQQVAGYITKFDEITFMTVHFAGHEVAMFQPARALEMLKNYLAGDLN